MKSKIRRHVIADKAPVVIAIFAILFGMIGLNIITMPLNNLYGKISMDLLIVLYNGINILISLVILALYIKWFRPKYEGDFNMKGAGASLKAMLPFIVFWLVWGIIKSTVISYCEPLSVIGLTNGIRAGFVEEIFYRGIALSVMLRKYHEKENVWKPTVFIGILFGLTHLLNLTSGDDVIQVVATAVFATSVGFIFGAAYTLSGNLWVIAIVHAVYDVWAFAINVDDVSDWISLAELAVTAVIAVWAVIMLKRRSEDAAALWTRKWNRNTCSQEGSSELHA